MISQMIKKIFPKSFCSLKPFCTQLLPRPLNTSKLELVVGTHPTDHRKCNLYLFLNCLGQEILIFDERNYICSTVITENDYFKPKTTQHAQLLAHLLAGRHFLFSFLSVFKSNYFVKISFECLYIAMKYLFCLSFFL